MKRAIVYAREVPGESLQEQIDACRKRAVDLGFTPVGAMVDLQTPGPAYRIGLRAVLDIVSAEDAEALVAPNPERLSTDPARLSSIREMLQEKNCALYYVDPQ